MATGSLLLLLDDIATVLDDVAVMTKVAAKKTAGVLGDDLALNAKQVSGVRAERELPVVWAVAKGSAVNKLILVPSALAISWAAPWLIVPLLMVGGLYLCFEGFEKIAHGFLHSHEEDKTHHAALLTAVANTEVDLVAFEREKIKGAVRTDFVLSAEIVVITLGTVATASFTSKVAVLVGISVLMTVGVYGLVAGIVKLDDAGLHLTQRAGPGAWVRMQQSLGRGLLRTAPILMKLLSVVGTAAMFMVGGDILVHGLGPVQKFIDAAAQSMGGVAHVGAVLNFLTSLVLNALVGVVAGGLALLGWLGARKAYALVRRK